MPSPEPIPGRCGKRCPERPEQGRPGGYCTQRPMRGQAVCKMHGGMVKRNRAAAEVRLAEQEAERYLARYGKPVAIHPADALLETVHARYGDLLALRDAVVALAPDELAWGETEVKTVGATQFPGVDKTSAARLHPLVVLYDKTLTDLTSSSSIALKTDVMLRREQRDEQLGSQILDVLVRFAAILGYTGADVMDKAHQALTGGAAPTRVEATRELPS